MHCAGHHLEMEIDTGSAVTLISNNIFSKFFKEKKLDKTNAKLRTHTGEDVNVLGTTAVQVKYNDELFNLPLIVVGGQGLSLLGRDWLEQLRMTFLQVNQFTASTESVNQVKCKYPDLWKSDLGQVKGLKAKIIAPENALPKFFKPRPVAYYNGDAVDEELQRLEREGVIKPVQFAEWAAPVVPIKKVKWKDSSVW